jgi:hypothetical protein
VARLPRASGCGFIHLLRDARFAPAGPDLKALAAEEERLRKESSILRDATAFAWFNGNASDPARRALSSFDVMRAPGIAPILSRHEAIFQRLEQQR